jgi:hypothetical protein
MENLKVGGVATDGHKQEAQRFQLRARRMALVHRVGEHEEEELHEANRPQRFVLYLFVKN